jgi:hypothetical protein
VVSHKVQPDLPNSGRSLSGTDGPVHGDTFRDVDADEIPLPGGDVTEGVVRVGSTVRRPMGEHSPVVHGVLRHLEAVEFDGSPRLLGIDDRGREVLTFVEGEVAGRPWPAWVADESRALSVARLVRRLDDALVPLGIPEGYEDSARQDGSPAPVGPTPSFLGHRDVTPENVVFRAGQAHALIDFDFVRPSSRVDEVVSLLTWWAGWMAPQDRNSVLRPIDPADRGRRLVDAYGLTMEDREWVVPVAISTAQRAWFSMRDRAERLGGGWRRMWSEGVGDRIQRREQWLREQGAQLGSGPTDKRQANYLD